MIKLKTTQTNHFIDENPILSTQQSNKLSRSTDSESIQTLLSGLHKKPFSEKEKSL